MNERIPDGSGLESGHQSRALPLPWCCCCLCCCDWNEMKFPSVVWKWIRYSSSLLSLTTTMGTSRTFINEQEQKELRHASNLSRVGWKPSSFYLDVPIIGLESLLYLLSRGLPPKPTFGLVKDARLWGTVARRSLIEREMLEREIIERWVKWFVDVDENKANENVWSESGSVVGDKRLRLQRNALSKSLWMFIIYLASTRPRFFLYSIEHWGVIKPPKKKKKKKYN